MLGHHGKHLDQLPELVRLYGEVGALDRLEEAQQVCDALAAGLRKKGHHAAAAGYDAAKQRLKDQARDLVERFADGPTPGLFT
jgi:hypothetical protein